MYQDRNAVNDFVVKVRFNFYEITRLEKLSVRKQQQLAAILREYGVMMCDEEGIKYGVPELDAQLAQRAYIRRFNNAVLDVDKHLSASHIESLSVKSA